MLFSLMNSFKHLTFSVYKSVQLIITLKVQSNLSHVESVIKFQPTNMAFREMNYTDVMLMLLQKSSQEQTEQLHTYEPT